MDFQPFIMASELERQINFEYLISNLYITSQTRVLIKSFNQPLTDLISNTHKLSRLLMARFTPIAKQRPL